MVDVRKLKERDVVYGIELGYGYTCIQPRLFDYYSTVTGMLFLYNFTVNKILYINGVPSDEFDVSTIPTLYCPKKIKGTFWEEFADDRLLHFTFDDFERVFGVSLEYKYPCGNDWELKDIRDVETLKKLVSKNVIVPYNTKNRAIPIIKYNADYIVQNNEPIKSISFDIGCENMGISDRMVAFPRETFYTYEEAETWLSEYKENQAKIINMTEEEYTIYNAKIVFKQLHDDEYARKALNKLYLMDNLAELKVCVRDSHGKPTPYTNSPCKKVVFEETTSKDDKQASRTATIYFRDESKAPITINFPVRANFGRSKIERQRFNEEYRRAQQQLFNLEYEELIL